VCGVPLEQQHTGRTRLFCSSAHRVHYHRQQRRITSREALHDVAETADTPVNPTPAQQISALENLVYLVEEIQLPGRFVDLPRLASYAYELLDILDVIDDAAQVLDHGIPEALDDLQRHRDTLERLCELDGLGHDIREMAHDIQRARTVQEEIQWQIEELDEQIETARTDDLGYEEHGDNVDDMAPGLVG